MGLLSELGKWMWREVTELACFEDCGVGGGVEW